jgi:hypothetical protein
MRARGLKALVLCAFLAQLALPFLHSHESHGHACAHDCAGPAVGAAEAETCAVCELIALKAPALAASPAPHAEGVAPPARAAAPDREAEPRDAALCLAHAPRGPPAPPAL